MAWNDEATGTDKLSDKILLGVESAAARRANTEHKKLLSSDSTERQKCLKQIIGRDLARTISKTDELKELFAHYVYNIQSYTFGDRTTAEELLH